MKIVTFGELLMRLTPPGNFRFAQADTYRVVYGGAEANTAISLSQMGHKLHYVTQLPDTMIGRTAIREVMKWGVNVDNVKFSGEKMGIYFLERGISVRGGQIIYDRKNSSFSEVDENSFDWESILDGADWFHWTGITPALSEGTARACFKAITVAHKMGIPISCDLNYRGMLWKYGADPKDVMPELISMSTVVLANEKDVANYLGIEPTEDDYQEVEGFGKRCHEFVSKALVERFPNIKTVVTTLRQTINATHNRWSGVVYHEGNFITGKVYDLNSIVERIGGGDSFMGAYLHGVLEYKDQQMALDFGLAASSLKLTVPGDYNIATEQEINHFMNSKSVGRINR